jgi:hypothetical protein
LVFNQLFGNVEKAFGEYLLFFSISNSAGVFAIENLQQGTYIFSVDGKSVQPEKVVIDENTNPFQELNLHKGV